MAIALLAGLPNRYLQRVKNVLADAAGEWANWEFAFVVSQGGPDLLLRDRKRIFAEAESRGSLHVLGFSAERDRDNVAAQIRPYFRFRWFDHTTLHAFDTPDSSPFVTLLSSVLTEEFEWAERVKPRSHSDALLLPEPCFACSSAHYQMWSKAKAYGATDSVPAAEKAISGFEHTYNQRIQFQTYGQPPRSQYKWMDDRRLVFDENGPRHGIAPVPRAWKYSYRLEDGFHYDVSKQNRAEFKITDVEGRIHSVVNNGYINLEAHGYVR
jgi:hypothetical protein